MDNNLDSKNQKARLALILKTGRLRLWFFFPATRRYCYLSETGEYGREHNPAEFARYFHRDDLDDMRSIIFDVCDGKRENGKVTIRSRAAKEADCRLYEMSVSVVSRDERGIATLLMGIQHDVTEEHRRKEKARELLMRYHTIFNSSLLDMLYYDKNGVLTDINDRACKAFNVKSREQVLDGTFLLKNNPFYNQIPLKQMENSYSGSVINFNDLHDRVYRLDELGLQGRMYYESAINPIRNEKGDLEGIYMSGHDITEMVESFHKLQAGIRQLQQGTKDIKQYIANIDYALSVSGVQMVNYYPKAYTFEIVNRETDSRMRMSQLRCIRLATPRFRRTVNSVLNRMDHLTKNGIVQAVELEIRDKKGRQIWLLFSMVPMLDAEGNVERYFGMFRDITNTVETEQRLAAETKKAQETELLKQAFLTNMSYEIRTPLNNIIGYARLFAEQHEEHDEPFFIEQIKKSTNELLLLVNDVLFISRLDANMEEYNREPVDFALAFEPQCRIGMATVQPGVQTLISQPYNSLVVDIDLNHVGMIIQRLCALSCLSTTHGSIAASYEYRRGELTINIENTGAGVTLEDLDHIYEHFSRKENGNMTGSGLDMPIVQLLVKQMGGSIDIQSDYGKGTSVWVSIPCTATVIEKKRELDD
ncbi:MAG: PAS domain S-box protein [Prevotella sp.]|nr:PAS domain S-box protein [Prevotella sp.]